MFRKLAAAVVVLTMTMQARATDPVQLFDRCTNSRIAG